jgi:hypothetical protein
MNPGCRMMGVFLVGLALLQSLPVGVEAWQAQRWPGHASEWLRLALLPAAVWLYVRYFRFSGHCACGDDDDLR